MAVKAIAIISRLEKIFLRTRLSRPYQNVSKCYHTVIKMFLLKLQTFSVKSEWQRTKYTYCRSHRRDAKASFRLWIATLLLFQICVCNQSKRLFVSTSFDHNTTGLLDV